MTKKAAPCIILLSAYPCVARRPSGLRGDCGRGSWVSRLASIWPGPLNAITDVGGVRVGHTTVIEGNDVRDGVTAVLTHAGNLFQEKVAGAVFIGNAFGTLAGSTQVTELGTIEAPVVLTITLSLGVAMDAVVRSNGGGTSVRKVDRHIAISSKPYAGSNPTPALFIVWHTGMGFLIGCFWPTSEAREPTRLSIVEPREESANPNPL